jgi:1,2-dihydroxy-3-keto-5-methylthiopentene dioxygenase
MAVLNIPDNGFSTNNPSEIKSFLNERGVFFDQWETIPVNDSDTMEEILAKYDRFLKPYMDTNGYRVADVININSSTENYPAIRAKFLSEHIHTEDEVRYFIDGQGYFWFHLESGEIFNVLCQSGDLISVPAGTKHWFDAGETNPNVKTIRIFIDMSGWVPHYTDSKIEQNYLS